MGRKRTFFVFFLFVDLTSVRIGFYYAGEITGTADVLSNRRGNFKIGFKYSGAITGTADILPNRTAVTTDAPFGTFVGYHVSLPMKNAL